MAKLEQEAEVARALVAYGRWRAATSAADDAARETAAADALHAKAVAKDSEAAALERRAQTTEEEVARRAASLPTDGEAGALVRLERDLAMADAALGGGIRVALRPRAGMALRVLADQATVIDDPDVSTERVVEAERRIELAVGELLDIEVTAGGAEQCRAADAVRARWNAEVVPVLDRAGLKSLDEVTAACAEVAKVRVAAAELRKSVAAARAEAASLRDRAAEQAARAAKLTPDPSEIEARGTAIHHAVSRKQQLTKFRQSGVGKVRVSPCGKPVACAKVERLKRSYVIDQAPALPLAGCDAGCCQYLYEPVIDELE